MLKKINSNSDFPADDHLKFHLFGNGLYEVFASFLSFFVSGTPTQLPRTPGTIADRTMFPYQG